MSSSLCREIGESDEYHDDGEPRKPIAEPDVRSHCGPALELRVDDAVSAHRDDLEDPAGRIDVCGDARRRGAQHVAIAFHCPEPGLCEMLRGRRASIEPGVVG